MILGYVQKTNGLIVEYISLEKYVQFNSPG